MRGLFSVDFPSVLRNVDDLCGQIALALHDAEWQIYLTLTVILVLTFLILPPKNDPDQL